VRIPSVLSAYASDARAAFRHTPVEVLLGLATAAVFSATIRTHSEKDFARVLVAFAIALPLVFGLSVLRARGVISAPLRWAATVAVVAGAALYGALWVDAELAADRWRAPVLVGVSVFALSLVPVLGRREPGGEDDARRQLWWFNATLLARAVTVAAYGLALYAALAGAVSAVVGLFELDRPAHLYGDLFGIIAFALVPLVVVGGLPELAAGPGPTGAQPPRTVRYLGRYLYFPVLVVYLAILLAYTAKVAVTWEFPKNLLSPIVIFAGLCGFLGAALLQPLHDDPEHRLVGRLARLFPLLLLVLLPLAFVAVLERQADYGWTEFRYLRLALLAALAILAVAGTVRLVRGRPPLLAAVPLVLGAVLLLSSAGPWSASAVSRRDQTARLRAALARTGLLSAGGTVHVRSWRALPDSAKREVPAADYDRVSGALTYLAGAHGTKALRGIFPGIPDTLSGYEILPVLPIRPGCAPNAVAWRRAELADGTPLPGIEGGTLSSFTVGAQPAPGDTARPGGVRLVLDPRELRVSVPAEGWSARVELGRLVDRLSAASTCGIVQPGEGSLSPAEAVHPLVDERGVARGQVVVMGASVGAVKAPAQEGKPHTRNALGLQSVNGLLVRR
jgi:hypothetical protein